jgi:Uma2 family endonuclease
MVTSVSSPSQPAVFYPDSDGQPMADNTKQFRWIVFVKENLELLFADRPDVFVAGDLLWYPIEGNNQICTAPDTLVVIGRPKGDRGFYQQWQEANIAPQVVFEILSPGNTPKEMIRKFKFYELHGVEEYYLYDPDRGELSGWLRSEDSLEEIPDLLGWVSPLLGVRFGLVNGDLQVDNPNGQPWLTHQELAQQTQQAQQQAEQAEHRAEQAEQQLQALRDLLTARGIDPDHL